MNREHQIWHRTLCPPSHGCSHSSPHSSEPSVCLGYQVAIHRSRAVPHSTSESHFPAQCLSDQSRSRWNFHHSCKGKNHTLNRQSLTSISQWHCSSRPSCFRCSLGLGCGSESYYLRFGASMLSKRRSFLPFTVQRALPITTYSHGMQFFLPILRGKNNCTSLVFIGNVLNLFSSRFSLSVVVLNFHMNFSLDRLRKETA